MISDTVAFWRKLTEHSDEYFREGILLKFKTTDTAGNHYKFALGVRVDHAEDLSFVGLDGRGWGYGRCTLPEEARFQAKPSTVSREWLLENFIHICEPEDYQDIWVCKKAFDVLGFCL